MPIILATQEVEISRILVQSQSQANSSQEPISKNPITKKDWWSGSSSKSTYLASVSPSATKKKRERELTSQRLLKAQKVPQTLPRLAKVPVTSPDYVISLFLRDPVKDRVWPLALRSLQFSIETQVWYRKDKHKKIRGHLQEHSP
jgi:hypothetical protein